MNPPVTTQENRLRWFLAALIIGLSIVVVPGFALYPQYQAQQWEEQLWTCTDSHEALMLVQKLMQADNRHADAVLTNYANELDTAVFAAEHRVMLFFDDQTGQPYSSTRWSADNMSPNITARFVNPRIVENRPEAVTIAATNEINGSTCLFFFTYKHNGHSCELSEDELAAFETNGYWNEYVVRNGDPVAEKRKTWIQSEVDSWEQWKNAVNAAFD